MAFAEFKRDRRDGRFLFIEVNGRAVLFNSVLPPTGVDLVAMAWSDFALGEPPRASADRLERRLGAPPGGAALRRSPSEDGAARHRRAPRALPASAAFGDWSASDPAPFLAQSGLAVRDTLADWGRRLTNGRR